MKAFLYILIFFIPLLKLQGQSQLLNGTIKAKKNYSYTYLPASTETKTPELPSSSIQDFYPPLQYTLPPNNNFKALTFEWGSFIASKNKPIILEPQPIDTTPVNAAIPKKEGVLDPLEPEHQFVSTGVLDPLDAVSQNKNTNTNTSNSTLTPLTPAAAIPATKTVVKSEGSVLLTPSKPASTNDEPVKNNTFNANNGSIVLTPSKPASATNDPVKNNTFNANNGSIVLTPSKPAAAINQQVPTLPEKINTTNNAISLSKPVEEAVNKPVSKIVTPPILPQINSTTTTSPVFVNNNNTVKPDYKIYLDEYGKYNIVFSKDGGSITVSQFGRVNAVVIPTNSNTKPTYNYRGLLESVGSLQVQYTYEGRVLSIGSTNITYNYNGNIETISGTNMLYNANGSIAKIGSSKVNYDYTGKITHVDAANAMIVVKQ